MAILLVKIEDENSLALNEFFDYCGRCYASTRSREKTDSEVIDMSNFYDAAVNTEILHDIPVVFVSVEEKARVLGWYKKAEIFHQMHMPSLFLEGNIQAYSSDAVWLPNKGQTMTLPCFAKNQLYEVVEEEDARFYSLDQFMKNYSGENQFLRYHTAAVHIVPRALKELSLCQDACRQWAELIIEEKCRDIRDLKTLEGYARKLCEIDRKNPDGYYYLALACYHLGLVKEGLKQINKAIKLEGEASDLLALKGFLLVSRAHREEGAAYLQKAYEKSQYEAYLLMEGRVYLMEGKVDKAYDCFKQIEEESLLEEMGIKLKEMEKKWNSIRFGYWKIRDIFRKK